MCVVCLPLLCIVNNNILQEVHLLPRSHATIYTDVELGVVWTISTRCSRIVCDNLENNL